MVLLSQNSLWLILVLASCIASVIVFYLISKWRRRSSCRRRFKHGINAEKHIEGILRSYGYEVVGLQKSIPMVAYVDGERLDYKVRPDGIARKGVHEYFVEMKTGAYAVNPMYSNTRRQLLEYYYNSSVEGVLLVNGDSGSVQLVQFGGENVIEYEERKGRSIAVFVAFLLGALASSLFFLLW